MRHYATYPSLEDRVVFITGGAEGIGGNMVQLFAKQGSKVAFIDINKEASERNIKACIKAGCKHPPIFLECDVHDIERLEACIDETVEKLGNIQVLVNNAANDDRHTFGEIRPDYWDERFEINLRHQFFSCQRVAPSMKAAGSGSIINIGSSSWMIKEDCFPAYAIAKSAVQGLTRTLAHTLGPDEIRVNSVLPGWVVTDR